MPTHPAVLSPQADLTPLEAFPWLARSAPVAPAARGNSRKARPDHKQLLVHAGLAVAFAALYAGVSLGTGGSPAEDPLPALQQTRPAQAAALTNAATAPQVSGADGGAGAETLSRIPATPAAGRDVPALAASAPARLVTRSLAPPPRIEPSRLDAEPAATLPPSGPAAPSAAATADSPVTAAALKEFRAAIDEGKDTAREVIRLGNRQRPKAGASAEDMTRYRLRQQNAEAAKTYRSYLDTLARTVRAAKSETVTRQSLDRARQTLGYLATMQADSMASLR